MIRLTISIEPETHEAFQQLADAASIPLGRCISDWLDDTAEAAELAVLRMSAARRVPAMAIRKLLADAEVEAWAESGEGSHDVGKRAAAASAPSSNTGLNPPHGRKRRAA